MVTLNLALGVQAPPCVVEVDVLTDIQTGIFRGAQIVKDMCGWVGWIGAQKSDEIGIIHEGKLIPRLRQGLQLL